jgi:hypothetical protein
MPFQMIYKPAEMFFFPVIFSVCLYAADLWLLFNLPLGETTLSLFVKTFLTASLAVPLIGFWAIKQHGSFVISADKKGIYYRKMDDKQQFFLLDWGSVSKLNITVTSKRTLVIETTFNKFKKDKLPLPCNGSVYFLESGIICLEFNTSFWFKTASILQNLTELRRRYLISKGQPDNT